MAKKLLFSVSIRDCQIDTFRGSGAGGQARNKTSSGVRVTHPPSGAIGKSSEAREQHINKRTAFLRMIETKEFKTWQKIEAARCMGKPSVEELVEKEMAPKNIRTEVKDTEGNWIIEVPTNDEEV